MYNNIEMKKQQTVKHVQIGIDHESNIAAQKQIHYYYSPLLTLLPEISPS
jgi:hypothetical protein